MLLKYNRDTELEIVGLGIFQPDQFIVVGDEEKAKRYLDSGYFDEVKEKEKNIDRVIRNWKITAGKISTKNSIYKKSKKKGVDK